MTCIKMVEKLLIVNDDPFEIWKAFEDFQPGFFAPVLHKNYNIDKDFASHVLEDYKKEVEKYKSQIDQRIQEIKHAYMSQNNKKQSAIFKLEQQLDEAIQSFGPKLDTWKRSQETRIENYYKTTY